MKKLHWLVKSEPETYPWTQLVNEKQTAWTGVRNYAARLHLRAMQAGDPVLFYHSGDAKEVVGIAKVAKTAYPDPTAEEGDWSCVDLIALKPFKKAVSLASIKAVPALQDIALVRQSRLSVSPLSPEAYELIVKMGS